MMNQIENLKFSVSAALLKTTGGTSVRKDQTKSDRREALNKR